MPRAARIDYPGLLQHVIVRGIERRNIFFDDQDRQSFLDRFSDLLQPIGTACFAWALLDNHVHFLLLPEQTSLARFMRRLLTGHATTVNLRHRRSGRLFQNRYKSIVCEEETYLLELVRYNHLNSQRAGAVSNMDALDRYIASRRIDSTRRQAFRSACRTAGIAQKEPPVAKASSVLCYFAVREMGLGGEDVVRTLNISRAGVIFGEGREA
jgi:REP element-mobilizing transposase RayT